MSLKKQEQFNNDFKAWFDGNIKPTLDKNRKRYAMEVEDADKKKELGLSAIPSTKTSSVVDRAVDRAIMEYHGEQDAITFTAKNAGNKDLDFLAAIHTENFHIRAENNFPFPVWNATSLTAGFVDGLEGAMVSWRKESYQDKKTVYMTVNEMGQPVEIDEAIYNEYSKFAPDFFYEEEIEEEVVTLDSWWVDQLLPGENVLWDPKAPLLNVNMGQVCLVKLERTVDQIVQMGESGVIDEVTKEELYAHQDSNKVEDYEASGVTDPDLGAYNTVELWVWFEKDKGRWQLEFSIEGKMKLSEPKDLNEVWYNGRRVNKLPVVVGTTKLKPFLAIGRGLPETIGPVEDEYQSLRNLSLDKARQDIEGRWRVNPDSDVDLNELINSPVVRANQFDVEKFDNRSNNMGVTQQISALVGDINELAPVGMESSQIVPNGNDKTLGAIQLALGSSNEKLSVALMVRNFTFFRPLIHLISDLTIAFETDENILKIAEARVSKQRQHQGQQLPQKGGKIDLERLDIPLNVQINAGLGSVPRQQKLQYMTYLGEAGAKLGIPLDGMEMFRQGSVLLGFAEDQFVSTEPPSPPSPELKGTVNIDFDRLPPQMQMMVLQTFAQGQEIRASFKGTGDLEPPPMPGPQLDPVMGTMNGL